MLMSSVHPRTKKHVGDRLAAGAWKQSYGGTDAGVGPVVSGCTVKGNTIVLHFNTTLLASDQVLFKGFVCALYACSGVNVERYTAAIAMARVAKGSLGWARPCVGRVLCCSIAHTSNMTCVAVGIRQIQQSKQRECHTGVDEHTIPSAIRAGQHTHRYVQYYPTVPRS